MAVAWRK